MGDHNAGDARDLVFEPFSGHADESWPLEEFIATMSGILAEIPEEHRSTAVVYMEGDYDERSKLRVQWTRPETDEERVARMAEEAAEWERYKERRRAEERALYERLKAKYGDKTAI